MANENYENVNDRTTEQPSEQHEQHEQQMDNRKPKVRDMLEALETSMDYTRGTLTRAFNEVRNNDPESGIGSVVRLLHLSVIKTINENPLESFRIVLGFIGFAIFDSLTDEDKEALRNDSLDNNQSGGFH